MTYIMDPCGITAAQEKDEAEIKRLRVALEEIANGKYNGRLAVIIANLALYPILMKELNVRSETDASK